MHGTEGVGANSGLNWVVSASKGRVFEKVVELGHKNDLCQGQEQKKNLGCFQMVFY